MQKKILITIIFITVTLIMGAWSMGMTASNPTFLKFYLIFIPLLIFQSLEFYFILKLKSNSKNKRILKLISVFILPIGMLLFLFISFGESKNKICFSGDCENGYGEALYIKDERTTKSTNEWNDGEIQYYKPEFLGRNWFNNITGMTVINRLCLQGNFKNGYFDGDRIYFGFCMIMEKSTGYTWTDKSDDFINGLFYTSGQFERGRVLNLKESRHIEHNLKNFDINKLLQSYHLDNQGYYFGR